MNNLLLPPPPLKPLHYSTSDWDFSTTTWSLSAQEYHSWPTSLRLWNTTGTEVAILVLSRIATVQNLPQGRIVSWVLSQWWANSLPSFYFRNQSPLDTAARLNGYYTRCGDGATILYRSVAGVVTTLGRFYYDLLSDDTWYLFRITWWNDGPINLTVRLEIWDGEQWIVAEPDLHDPDNYWKDSTINRLGIGAHSIYASPTQKGAFHDDTEIWGPAT